MSVKLIETAKARRQLLVEKKRLTDEIRKLRLARTANKPLPVVETLHGQTPAA